MEPQLGQSLRFDEAPIGMKAAKSGKMAQNIVCTQSSPPRCSERQIRYASSASVTAYSPLYRGDLAS